MVTAAPDKGICWIGSIPHFLLLYILRRPLNGQFIFADYMAIYYVTTLSK